MAAAPDQELIKQVEDKTGLSGSDAYRNIPGYTNRRVSLLFDSLSSGLSSSLDPLSLNNKKEKTV